MTRYLADFQIESQLCLPEGAEPLVIEISDPLARMEISNIEGNTINDAVLSAQITFESDSLEDAQGIAVDLLGRCLNALSFGLNFRFGPSRMMRLLDWSPALLEREAYFFAHEPMREQAFPELEQRYCATASRLVAMQSDERLQQSLRWFRLGLSSALIEEQFTYFWMSLEIASEMLKGQKKDNPRCPKCSSPLYCEHCEKHPEYVVSGNAAVRDYILRAGPPSEKTEEIARTLLKIRNALAHGRRMLSIKNLPCTEEEAVHELHRIAWSCLFSAANHGLDPMPDEPLDVGAPDHIVHLRLTMKAHVKIGMPLDCDGNPQFEQIPKVDVSILKPNRGRQG